MAKNTNIVDINFDNALSDRYLSYALSTIMSRSLPDVRDGLKPVHRRLLYAMYQLKLDPKTGFKKCARIVGDVIGKYHPHGEVAVYDALVRMAQHFASRYPLINGQGNFGSIDGDNQAAMRYTEAKLTEYATYLLQDIESNTVDFRPNYDGSDDEPVILPSIVPNLLANGTEGIAVGMATSVPPHNILELLDATSLLLEKPEATHEEIGEIVKGPDFPTGGILVESKENIARAQITGRGSFRLRAKWHKEEMDRGMYRIVITEIPYQIHKRAIIEKMADLYNEKKIPFIENFQDLSAEDIRIVITPKSRNIEANVIMEHLFKMTDLDIRVPLNLNVLSSESLPTVMSIKQVLEEFIGHRHEVTARRLKNRLSQVEHRLEILGGLLVAYLNLDEVIRIIREEDEPKAVMIAKWSLTDVQAEAILNTRLRSLRRLEEMQIKNENDALTKEKGEIEDVLGSKAKLRKLVLKEIKEVRKDFSKNELYQRRTSLEELHTLDIPEIETFVEKEPLTITCSELGWLKAIKGHNKKDNLKYKEGDSEKYVFEVMSNDKLLVFTDYGKCYTIPCDRVNKGKGDGEPIKLAQNIDQDETILMIFHFKPETKLLLASTDGRGFVVMSDDVLAQTKGGKQVMTVEPTHMKFAAVLDGEFIVTVGDNRRLLIFEAKEIPTLKKGRGVTLQKFKGGKLKDILVLKDITEIDKYVPSIKQNTINLWKAKRAALGRLVLGKMWFDRKS